jgi:hypothetical protein
MKKRPFKVGDHVIVYDDPITEETRGEEAVCLARGYGTCDSGYESWFVVYVEHKDEGAYHRTIHRKNRMSKEE